ncbi:MAG TPA: hypothetical protein VF554_05265 [Thermoanaerobaculia bacterium]|jgi:hypothetical protein
MSLKRSLTSALLVHVLFEGHTWVFDADGRRSLATREVTAGCAPEPRSDLVTRRPFPATGAGLSGWGRKPE